MPRKNSTRKNNRNNESIQEIDKLIQEAKRNDLPSCFMKCSKPNCNCFTINVKNFLNFIGNEQQDVFGVILTDSSVSKDFKDVSYNSIKLCEYINEYYNEEFPEIISIIKSANKEVRNTLLSMEKTKLINHVFPEELDNDSDSDLIDSLNSASREFKTLRITNKVATFYVSILEYNDKLDECSKKMAEQQYLDLTNNNSKIIDTLRECCKTLLKYFIFEYIIETLNKH